MTPGRVLTNSSAGRMVWAVVWAAPETMPSTMPELDHHGAEVAPVQHDLAGPWPGPRPCARAAPRTSAAKPSRSSEVAGSTMLMPAGRCPGWRRARGRRPRGPAPSARRRRGGAGSPRPAGSGRPLPSGQHDVPALRAGPLDQLVQEAQRRHPFRPRQVQPFQQLGLVHAAWTTGPGPRPPSAGARTRSRCAPRRRAWR